MSEQPKVLAALEIVMDDQPKYGQLLNEHIAELEEQLAQTQRLYRERDEFAQSLVEDVKQLQYERGQAGKRAIAAEKIIEKAQDDISFAMQADLEHGVWWLNEEASRKFTEHYPELRKALTAFMDIDLDD